MMVKIYVIIEFSEIMITQMNNLIKVITYRSSSAF